IQAIEELAREAGKPAWNWQAPAANTALMKALADGFKDSLGEAYRITEKHVRYDRVGELKNQAVTQLAGEGSEFSADEVKNLFKDPETSIVRHRILKQEARIDGRDNKTVRGISVEVGVLAKAHGSALFTRGETQAIGVATLGTTRDSQTIDALEGERKDHFMLHYNFPPYSVGEAGRMGGV